LAIANEKENPMEMSRIGLLAIIMLGAVLMIGCTHGATPNLDRNWGKSYEAQKYSQIRNPEAGKDTAAREGIDGIQSDIVTDKYYDTFTTKQPRPVYNIDMPGVTSN
jgi:hypothetical protein